MFAQAAASVPAASIAVTMPGSAFPAGVTRLTGHLIVVFAKGGSTKHGGEEEPRDQVQEQYDSAQAFGVDVEGLRPGGTVLITEATAGYPLRRLSEVPAGAGVVADSVPEREYEECRNKARGVIRAIERGLRVLRG